MKFLQLQYYLFMKSVAGFYLLASPVTAFMVVPPSYPSVTSRAVTANRMLGAPFSRANASPPIRMSRADQQQQLSTPPPDAFVESLKLRITLWAVEYFGIVSSETLPYQTLGFILNFMNKMKVYDLLFAPYWEKRLEDCVKLVVAEQDATTTMILPKQDLVGTTWRLAYTNEFAVMPPSRRMAYLTFQDPTTMRYSFQTDVKGWENIEAQCPYQINSKDAASSSGDALIFVFQQVTVGGEEATPAEGMMYGMRQGNSRTIQTAFFDGQYWIDASSNKMTIYVKEPERYTT